jgi:hypothetical protein
MNCKHYHTKLSSAKYKYPKEEEAKWIIVERCIDCGIHLENREIFYGN